MGCGAGVMSFLALQAGAGHVHAIECDSIIETARSLAEAGVADDLAALRLRQL